MSASPHARSFTLGGALFLTGTLGALAVAALLVARALRVNPAIEVRSQPRDVAAGRLLPGTTLGQGFVNPGFGVNRIDVPFQRLAVTREERVRLRLRAHAPDGRIVREDEAVAPATRTGSLRFEFDPPAPNVSPGDEVYVELESLASGPSDLLVFTRYRALAADRRNPAPGTASCGAVNGAMRPKADRLSGIAIAVTSLDPSRGPSALALFEEGRPDPVRVSRPEIPGRIADGWVFFPFEPVAESRWANYRFRVALPPETGVMGRCDHPAWIALHGEPGELERVPAWPPASGASGKPGARGQPGPTWIDAILAFGWRGGAAPTSAGSPLRGMTWNGIPMPDRDLVFTAGADGAWMHLLAGAGFRGRAEVLMAALAWATATGAVLALLARALRACGPRA